MCAEGGGDDVCLWIAGDNLHWSILERVPVHVPLWHREFIARMSIR